MADDKRAEAMRRAIADSDAQKSSSKPAKSNPLKEKLQIPGGTEGIKDSISKFIGSKLGKITVGAVAGVILLLIVVSVFSGISKKTISAPAQFEISDSIMNVYEDSSVPSGYAYDAFVELTNTGNSNMYVKDLSFKIEADDGTRIMIDNNINSFPAIVPPGEKCYIYNRFGTELTGVWDASRKLSLVPTFTVMRSDALPHNYPVTNLTIGRSAKGQTISATVENDTSKNVSSIYVVAVVYNEDGRCCGISGQFIRNVEPHVKVNVQFDPINMIRSWRNQTIVNYTVMAY